MKPYYITTAIPYTNAAPHIGTAMDYLYGDILLRYQLSRGRNAKMSIGTDEHGTKVEQKAADNNISAQELTDQLQPEFQKMRAALNLDFGAPIDQIAKPLDEQDFLKQNIINVRTTDPDHVRRVQDIWLRLDAAGVIYKSTYQGWYCVGCESFLTETEAKEVNYVCPSHNKPLEKLSEENYYLKVSQFTEKIREFATTSIVPKWRGKEILELIKDGAQDVSISRPKEKLTWGVPVPNDENQVMYVWVDALSNYITALGYPCDCHSGLGRSVRNEHLESKEKNTEVLKQVQDDKIVDENCNNFVNFWPADVEIVGKDILRFHAIIWPAMLLALELELPKKILAHGFINVGGLKMSKSIGNVVSPLDIIDEYGADAFRYYFTRHVPVFDDGDFTHEKFEASYNGELANDLGNLVSRVANMIKKYCGGQIPNGEMRETYEHDETLFEKKMREFDFPAALENIWEGIQMSNKYVDDRKPWKIAKSINGDVAGALDEFRDKTWPLKGVTQYDSREEMDEKDPARSLYSVLWNLAESLQNLGETLAPFLPETASKISEIFAGEKLPDEIPILFPKKYLYTEEPARR